MMRDARRWLLPLGAIVTVASSATIEVCLILLLTPVSAEPLRPLILAGIGGVAAGSLLMWLGSCSRRL